MKKPTSLRVAIQGDSGSYHDKAAGRYFGEAYLPLFCVSFEEVFAAVTTGEADYGLAAVENSLVGSIVPVYDLLRTAKDVQIVGEVYLAIHHSLIGMPDANLNDIRTVYSHPVALDQCRAFLKQRLPQAHAQPTHDTAGSVDMIQQLGDKQNGAIASADNATRLGLKVLAENIEDNRENYTRFLVLARRSHKPGDMLAATKTSLLMERLNDEADDSSAGTLQRALACLADNGVSLTKIESRPVAGRPWRYVFYLDCAAGSEDPRMQAAFGALEKLGATWRVLGTYKTGKSFS